MASGFGAYTDHFGILAITSGEGTLADVLEITASTKTPDPMSRAEATDANGDPAAATWYGNTAGELYDASTTFVCKSGSFSTDVLQCGELTAGSVVTSIEISTSNDGWPQITVSGKLGAETIVAPSGLLNTWTFPEITITGAKRAQLLGFTVGADCALTGSSLSGTIDLAQQEDGEGEPVAHGVSGGLLTQSVELVYVSDAPTWTKGGEFTETQAPGSDESQAAYLTTSAAAEAVWERDASV
jgi:hypothetical protein